MSLISGKSELNAFECFTKIRNLRKVFLYLSTVLATQQFEF